MLNFIWCALSGPQTGLELLSFGDTLQCQSERLPESHVRYTCTAFFVLSYSTYILEGREGWPFVRLVERRFEDS